MADADPSGDGSQEQGATLESLMAQANIRNLDGVSERDLAGLQVSALLHIINTMALFISIVKVRSRYTRNVSPQEPSDYPKPTQQPATSI